jgi:protein TonB
MIELSLTSARLFALCGSGLVHVGVALALSGHGAAVTPNARARSVAEVDISVAETVTSEAPSPLAPPVRPVASAVSRGVAHHQHRYPVRASHDRVPHDPALAHEPAHEPDAEPVADVTPLVSTTAAPRFVMRIGGVPQAAQGPVEGAPSGAHDRGTPSAPLAASEVDAPARLLAGDAPFYPEEARRHGVEADVRLELVVDAQGNVVEARLLDADSAGFAQAALRSARLFRFKPALRGGRAVAVRMPWTVAFRLH